MRQFFNHNSASLASLEGRARRACVVFQNQEMPTGTTPPKLRVGFELTTNDEALLYVDTGSHYDGNNISIREWLRTGKKRFANLTELFNWLETELAGEYSNEADGFSNSSVAAPQLSELTNFEEVRRNRELTKSKVKISSDELLIQLSEQVRGQNQALKQLTKKVYLHFARPLPRRPLSLFLLGPTGVGKTQSAETLATILRQKFSATDEFNYLRLDMAEYQESHRVSQLLGSPQGYIGYGDGSQLVDTLAKNSKTIILFDEIEKSHPNILKTLMNAMDAGRLSSPSSANGERQIDCRRAVFLFTTNLKVNDLLQKLETIDTSTVNQQTINEICRKHLQNNNIAPELVGRINSFLVYYPLSEETRIEILALSIVRVASEYGANISYIAPETLSVILQTAGKYGLGVRPDEYLIDDLLGNLFIEISEKYGTTSVSIAGTTEFYALPHQDTKLAKEELNI